MPTLLPPNHLGQPLAQLPKTARHVRVDGLSPDTALELAVIGNDFSDIEILAVDSASDSASVRKQRFG